jgi:predicted PurR-regulated permease PerM
MNRQQVFSLCFFAVLLWLLYQIALIFRPFFFPVLWAVILAHLAFPLHARLTTWLGGKEYRSAVLLTLGVMALVVVPLIMSAVMFVKEAASAEQAIREWIASGAVQRLPDRLSRLPGGSMARQWLERVAGRESDLEQLVLASAKTFSRYIVAELSDLVRDAFMLLADFLVMIFTLFFFFKDGRNWLQALYQLIPLDGSHKQKILLRLDQTIRAVVKGVVLTAMVQGLLAGAAYALLAAPFPIVLTALTILLAPLPLGGTALIWAPLAGYFFWMGFVGKGVIMMAWGAGVVSTVDQILKPLFIGQGAQIPVLLLTFSVLGGLAVYGIIGLFLGPILTGLFLTAVQIYRDEYQQPAPPSAPVVPSA